MPDVPLKEHIESLFDGVRREQELMRKSVDLARSEMERRLAELNQLRKEVIEDREQLIRRDIYEPAMKDLTKEVGLLADKLIELTSGQAANREAIAGLKASLGWLVRLVSGAVILALIAFLFRQMTGR